MQNWVFFSEPPIAKGFVEDVGRKLLDAKFDGGVMNQDIFSHIMIKTFQKTSESITSTDFLSAQEIIDVSTSWREIEVGESKEFTDVDDFCRELDAE